ncbi:MAG: oxidoreductase [Cryobacterium sp.]|jgi:2-polyprenyl-6-methoxyphenol hydroxylase-like FAD-dependent oxidoreductase|nr:oxidoreductase [Cryobacterium sp.]
MRDVVVVGGGPVGIFAGCLLASAGLDVEVVEQREAPSMRSRAIGIHPPSLTALERIGVIGDFIERAVKIRGGRVRCEGKDLGRLSFAEAGSRHAFVAALPQYETEALLRARFEELRPGGLRQGSRVTAVHERSDRVDLALAGPEMISARYVIAADGARSVVREAVGVGWFPLGRTETYLMGDFPDTTSQGDEAVLYFEREGVVESFPLPDGRRRWVAMTDGLRTNSSSADLAGIIRSRTGVDLPSSADPASPFRVTQHLASGMVVGRVVLIGDAAHEISPIGGQGMNLGWLDAVALAPVLQGAFHTAGQSGAIEGAAVTRALAEFERRRRRAARMAARQAAFNMSMGRPAGGFRLRARNGVVRVLSAPPFRGLLARAFTMRWL